MSLPSALGGTRVTVKVDQRYQVITLRVVGNQVFAGGLAAHVLPSSPAQAIALFNRYSPRFAASLISQDAEAHERFYAAIDAPFTGDGFTRWVDGQYALNRPELGLSNWEHGRLFARGGVLAGDGVFTVRARVRQTDLNLDRNPDTAKRF